MSTKQPQAVTEVASARLGSSVVACSDDFFAPKENLIKPEPPVDQPGLFTDRGKWMDGWESRRRRGPGHDWAVIELGTPAVIERFSVDTSFFTGNFPEAASIDGAHVLPGAGWESAGWEPLVHKSPLTGDSVSDFDAASRLLVSHLRLNIYPDGGVARLRAYGRPFPDWPRYLGAEVDLASAAMGAIATDCSDRHYCEPSNLLLPGPPQDMGDGWETRRRRAPGHDWAEIALAIEGEIRRCVVDTTFYKGNYPASCSIDVADGDGQWVELIPPTELGPDADHELIAQPTRASRVRINIFPDGGVARLRVWGTPDPAAVTAAALDRLNLLPEAAAKGTFLGTCGSKLFADGLTARRPLESVGDLLAAAEEVFEAMAEDDWLEAFAAHPRIGERKGRQTAAGEASSREEQRGMDAASDETRAELERLNAEYEARFGFIYIVSASGKGADELLEIAGRRVGNDRQTELAIASREQQQITRSRLRRLVAAPD